MKKTRCANFDKIKKYFEFKFSIFQPISAFIHGFIHGFIPISVWESIWQGS